MPEYNQDTNNDTRIPAEKGSEFNEFGGNIVGEEFEVEPLTPKVKKKRKVGLKVGSLVASATVLSVVAAMIVPTTPANVSAKIEELWATDTGIGYVVNVEKGAPKLVVYNDFTMRVQPLSEGDNLGSIDNLKPEMTYTIALKIKGNFGDQTISKTTIRTQKTQIIDAVSRADKYLYTDNAISDCRAVLGNESIDFFAANTKFYATGKKTLG